MGAAAAAAGTLGAGACNEMDDWLLGKEHSWKAERGKEKGYWDRGVARLRRIGYRAQGSLSNPKDLIPTERGLVQDKQAWTQIRGSTVTRIYEGMPRDLFRQPLSQGRCAYRRQRSQMASAPSEERSTFHCSAVPGLPLGLCPRMRVCDLQKRNGSSRVQGTTVRAPQRRARKS